ncbi:probable RNA-binding protein EIF1AD isoform X5 [Chiroxiphia lanceolata]|uniref:probable RNA-binding protein EIF1AD isoform X5 n=1 Tax=Chiroxiphia lanceolata TaxID=296741 RepID=UPI0013CE8B99|nr:probable RNA-binding protein EIF1AD isoform X5 [Chiroxiphia lanceolata]
MSRATKRKHVVQQLLRDSVEPRAAQRVVRVLGTPGNNLHEVETAEGTRFLASMPPCFRKHIWIKRGDFLLVDPIEEGSKVKAEISLVLLPPHVRSLQLQGLWPEAFGTPERPNSREGDGDKDGGLFVNTNRGGTPGDEDTGDSEEDTGDSEEDTGDSDSQEDTSDNSDNEEDTGDKEPEEEHPEHPSDTEGDTEGDTKDDTEGDTEGDTEDPRDKSSGDKDPSDTEGDTKVTWRVTQRVTQRTLVTRAAVTRTQVTPGVTPRVTPKVTRRTPVTRT